MLVIAVDRSGNKLLVTDVQCAVEGNKFSMCYVCYDIKRPTQANIPQCRIVRLENVTREQIAQALAVHGQALVDVLEINQLVSSNLISH